MLESKIDLSLLDGLSEDEKKYALQILKELSNSGSSKTYDNLKYIDYKEIPVDIETFLTDDRYLGIPWKDKNGKLKLYPFWLDVLKKLFPNNIETAYDTLLESGARGLGKSEIACGAVCAYLMYRVMCLKDPLEFFHLKPTEKIAFAFMNIKLDLSEAIANDKFQKTIQMSPWFMSKGTLTQRHNKPYWIPPEPIEIIIGSQADDIIGRPIFFCLDGNTKILTSNGSFKIEELENKTIQVPSINDKNEIILSNECTVKQTAISDIEYQITLMDNTVIKCTPSHRFMLIDGSYKEAKDLTEDDEIMDFVPYFIKNITWKKNNMKIKKIEKIQLETLKKYYDVINADPYNNFLIETNTGYIVSHNCFFDEISFQRNKDIEEQKKKALNMIDTAIGGQTTRFICKGKNPTLLVVASSKRSEQSFMESYIRTLSETQSDNTYIVDEPVWRVKPKGTYSEETFFIGLGNKRLDSIVIPDEDRDKLQQYKEKGYQIIEAPIDFRAKAIQNLERVLCDYAGISSFASNKFLSAARVSDVVDENIHNPMPDIIEVGNGKDDESQYYDFFDWEKLDKQYLNKPLFIHLDMSVSGDKTGIAGTWIIGKKPTSDGNPGKDLYYQLAFCTSVKAPKGRQISFEKNRNFIRWLKEKGFKIKEITSDTFQAFDLQQQLSAEGFKCSILSVDRVETPPGEKVGVCKPYQYLKNTIYEGRIKLPKTELLYTELVQLEKNNNNGKIDHPNGGRTGSKDASDALCGSTYTASKYAEEFAYDYGESFESIREANVEGNKQTKQQVIVDFEQALNNLYDPLNMNKNNTPSKKEERTIPNNILRSQGIIIW